MSEKDVLTGAASTGLRHERQPSLSVEYVVDAQHKRVTVRFGKKLTFGDIERYARRLQLNPSFLPT